jgi:hypothetical protein
VDEALPSLMLASKASATAGAEEGLPPQAKQIDTTNLFVIKRIVLFKAQFGYRLRYVGYPDPHDDVFQTRREMIEVGGLSERDVNELVQEFKQRIKIAKQQQKDGLGGEERAQYEDDSALLGIPGFDIPSAPAAKCVAAMPGVGNANPKRDATWLIGKGANPIWICECGKELVSPAAMPKHVRSKHGGDAALLKHIHAGPPTPPPDLDDIEAEITGEAQEPTSVGNFWGKHLHRLTMLYTEQVKSKTVGDQAFVFLVVRESLGLFASLGRGNYLVWVLELIEKYTWTDSAYQVALRVWFAFPVYVRRRLHWDELMEMFNANEKRLGIKSVDSFVKYGATANHLSEDVRLSDTQGGADMYSKRSTTSSRFAQVGNIAAIFVRSGVSGLHYNSKISPALMTDVVLCSLRDAIHLCLPGCTMVDAKTNTVGTIVMVTSSPDNGLVAKVEWHLVGGGGRSGTIFGAVPTREINCTLAAETGKEAIAKSKAAIAKETALSTAATEADNAVVGMLVDPEAVGNDATTTTSSITTFERHNIASLSTDAVAGGRFSIISVPDHYVGRLTWTLSGKDAATLSAQARAAEAKTEAVKAGIGHASLLGEDLVVAAANVGAGSGGGAGGASQSVKVPKQPPLRSTKTIVDPINNGKALLKNKEIGVVRGQYYQKLYTAMVNLSRIIRKRRDGGGRCTDQPTEGRVREIEAAMELVESAVDLERLQERLFAVAVEIEDAEASGWELHTAGDRERMRAEAESLLGMVADANVGMGEEMVISRLASDDV